MNTIRKRLLIILLLALAVTLLLGALLFKPAVAAEAAGDPTVAEFFATFETNKNASAEVQDNKLVLSMEGENGFAQVDTSSYGSGSRWYVQYLDSRNTMLLRIKNESDAQTLKIRFITRTQKKYDDEKLVELALEPNDGEFHTYFVNFTACPLAKGVLNGLRFSPDASSGKLIFETLSFEREKPLYDYAGEILSCTTDGYSVNIEGTVSEEYAGREITLYRTSIANLNESLKESLVEPLAVVQAAGREFSFRIPYFDGEVTMLGSRFLAAVGDVKVAPVFVIENWRDMTENPYAFDLPDYEVSVLDYGAAGDAYTDDTAAIQRAVDEVSARGGGVVRLEGDESMYGRRYVVSYVRLKSNVELRIEEGAVLWQSSRIEDYDYDVKVGHDVDGILWGHCALSYNYPLIYAYEVENVKVTGGGTVRLSDVGNQNGINGYRPSYTEYCKSLIHVIPIAFISSRNIEVTDVSILRTNCYHMVAYDCENVYFGNLTLTEDNCLSGDGISFAMGTHNAIIDRCFLYTDDDAIVFISMSIAEQRGKTWWHPKEDGGDNRLRDITVRHSEIAPGNILVLLTWGNDASDWTWQQFNGIYCYDNLLGTYATELSTTNVSSSINVRMGFGYPYGTVGVSTPVVNVRMIGNAYRGSIANMDSLQKTGWVTDCGGIDVESQFLDRDFYCYLGFWQFGGEYRQNVSAERSDGKATLDLDRALAEKYGVPSVYQGLCLAKGTYTFEADVAPENGASAKLFVRNSLTGELLHEQTVSESGRASLVFEIPEQDIYDIGIEGVGTAGKVVVGDFDLTAGDISVRGAYFEEGFEQEGFALSTYGWERREGENSTLTISEEKYGALRLPADYEKFDLRFDFRVDEDNSERAGEGTAFVRFSETMHGRNGYRVLFASRAGTLSLQRRTNGFYETLQSAEIKLKKGEWLQIGLRAETGGISVYANGETAFTLKDASLENSAIHIGFAYLSPELDNIAVGEAGSLTFSKSANWVEVPDEPDPEPPHEHSFSESWTTSETEHWHAAICEHENETSERGFHTFEGNRCTVCGYEKSGQSEDPNDPDNPDKPDNPDNPDKPDNPDNPDKPDNPEDPSPERPEGGCGGCGTIGTIGGSGMGGALLAVGVAALAVILLRKKKNS